MVPPDSGETFRFGDFVLDVAGYELRRSGRPVRLEQQPMDLLILLVQRRRQLVSRSDIIDRLWGKDVFVDVETGVHTAISKIRQALRDSPDAPAFIETVPGKGYRFIAPVEVVRDGIAAPKAVPDTSTIVVAEDEPESARAFQRPGRARLVMGAAVAVVAGFLAWPWLNREPALLAVLPFENLSGDLDREYLADGLAEETIASLGQVDPERVSVVGRTSMMAYKRTTKSLAEIGRELGADYLVESSIRTEGDRLRITSKLIRVRDQVQVWSESFDREPASMLGLQQELSSAIAEQIRLRLSPERLNALTRRQTQNPDAYDLYLRGLNFANQRTPPTTRRAIEYYERATSLDPDYALAWAGLAMAHAASLLNGDASPLEVGPHARKAGMQAVRADPNLAEAQFSLGYLNWVLEWDWTAAEAAFRRAIALDPRYPQAHLVLGHSLSQMGRHSEAAPLTRRARELDPLNAMTHALSSQVAFQARDYSAAVEYARQAIVIDPEFWIGYMQRGQALERLGKADLALEALTNAARFSSHNSKPVSLRGYMLAKLGRTNEAREVLRMLEDVSHQRYVPPYAMALVNAGLGEQKAMFEWLDQAYAARDVHLMFLTVDPKWDPYRADPRFIALLARCSFTRIASSASLSQ